MLLQQYDAQSNYKWNKNIIAVKLTMNIVRTIYYSDVTIGGGPSTLCVILYMAQSCHLRTAEKSLLIKL